MNVNELLGTGLGSVSTDNKANKELGQEDFLKLLVAQMKNQDPSSPADNGEFLSQIAQFSMVSGIDELGVSFDGIASSMYSTQAMQAASLVGREVLTESSSAFLTPGYPIDGLMHFTEAADAVTLTITDSAGRLVESAEIGVTEEGSQIFSWPGLDAEGNQLPAGEYSFSVTAFVNGEAMGMPVSLFKQVESVSVDRSNSSILLHLSGNESVGFSEISEYK